MTCAVGHCRARTRGSSPFPFAALGQSRLSLGRSSLWRYGDLKLWQVERAARQKEKEAGAQ